MHTKAGAGGNSDDGGRSRADFMAMLEGFGYKAISPPSGASGFGRPCANFVAELKGFGYRVLSARSGVTDREKAPTTEGQALYTGPQQLPREVVHGHGTRAREDGYRSAALATVTRNISNLGLPPVDTSPCVTAPRPDWLVPIQANVIMRAHIVDFWSGSFATAHRMKKYLEYLGFNVTIDQSHAQLGASCGYVCARNVVHMHYLAW